MDEVQTNDCIIDLQRLSVYIFAQMHIQIPLTDYESLAYYSVV